ncbi:MAG: DUF4954 family protein [Bacteroidales bacterium]|nr:DUF4954 family protein [Bacteroidales bacterium]
MLTRPLTNDEIKQLKAQHCTASDWHEIAVSTNFNATPINNVHFIGNNTLGIFTKEKCVNNGLRLKSGIYNTTLQNCHIADNCIITNATLINCNVEIEAEIINCKTIACVGKSTFGCGTKVNVLNETGGREVPICPELTAQIAYLLTFYRHDNELINALTQAIEQQTEQYASESCTVGEKACVMNCQEIINVNIGAHSYLHGVASLNNGNILSDHNQPTEIGNGVIAKHFIALWGSKITEQAIVDHCFIGEGSIVSKQFSATDSLIFSNSQFYHGEACAIFAGPFTVTHHKSTLLIGGYYSFYNAGSGSNQSNHMYRLGARHQGILERGTKTTSDSYILWPARMGAFSLIKGKHTNHGNTTNFPFSLLLENNGTLSILPGATLKASGTMRDEQKWRERDVRNNAHQQDIIHFDALNPYTIEKISHGLQQLKELNTNNSANIEGYTLSSQHLQEGIALYEAAIQCFAVEQIVDRLSNKTFNNEQELLALLQPQHHTTHNHWIDMAGMLMAETSIVDICKRIKTEQPTIDNINQHFQQADAATTEATWTFTHSLLKLDNKTTIIQLLKAYPTLCKTHLANIAKDIQKEYANNMQVGYGIDGNVATTQSDFATVHGDFEHDTFWKHYTNAFQAKNNAAQQLLTRIETLNA